MKRDERKKLYVAYGSNLNLSQMKFRCPSAKLYGTGYIDGYELDFHGRKTSAYATILGKPGSMVPAAVWEIGPEDERYLDLYEGYPSHYYKKEILVSLEEEDVTAMVYIMNPAMKPGLPSWNYYGVVAEGYIDCGLDVKYLHQALERSLQHIYYANGITMDSKSNMKNENEEGACEVSEHESSNEIRM